MSVFSPTSSDADVAPCLIRHVCAHDASARHGMVLQVLNPRVPLAVAPLPVPSIIAPSLRQEVEGRELSPLCQQTRTRNDLTSQNEQTTTSCECNNGSGPYFLSNSPDAGCAQSHHIPRIVRSPACHPNQALPTPSPQTPCLGITDRHQG